MSASQTCGSLGRCVLLPCDSTRAEASSALAIGFGLASAGTWPPGTAPAHVVFEWPLLRSPTNSVLLRPSVISAIRNRLFRRNGPVLLPGYELVSFTPLLAV